MVGAAPTQAGSNAAAIDSDLLGFEIAGSDKQWHPAQAHIVGEKVLVSAEAVAEPIVVRYAWRDFSTANL